MERWFQRRDEDLKALAVIMSRMRNFNFGQLLFDVRMDDPSRVSGTLCRFIIYVTLMTNYAQCVDIAVNYFANVIIGEQYC